MKVSYNWLKEVVDIPVDAGTLAKELTMVGIQLESRQAFENDITLDFEVTVNRPDCLNLYGIAREISVIFSSPPPVPPELHAIEVIPFRSNDARYSGSGRDVRILIEDADLCPRYCGQLITGVNIGASPDWLRKKLEACGLRSINNVVDTTNFVMLETGQPMHAFDFDKLAGGTIRVRKARNEKLMIIDGKERCLNEPMLAIADAERSTGVAGVMGGMDTEVTETTTTLLLESAYFQPASVRKTAKALEISSDASYRFERGVDYRMQATTCRRASLFVEKYAGGTIHPVLDVCPGRFLPAEIRLRQSRIARILGTGIDPHLADNILTSLGFIKKAENLWQVPSFRVDIFKEIDLIEEIARHYGYNKFPNTLPATRKKYQADYPTYEMERGIGQFLRGAGIDEACTYSFAAGSGTGRVNIINPISETARQLRTSLMPNLRESIEHNLRHRNENVRLFETGRIFLPEGEKTALGIAMLADYRELKGIVEQLLQSLQYERPVISEGTVFVSGLPVGNLTQTVADSHPLQLAEIYLNDLIRIPLKQLRYSPIISYPFVDRDVSFVLDETITYSNLVETIRNEKIPELRSWNLVDRYQGKNILAGKVSLTIRLIFQADDRTLTSEEVDAMFGKVVSALESNFRIQLRK